MQESKITLTPFLVINGLKDDKKRTAVKFFVKTLKHHLAPYNTRISALYKNRMFPQLEFTFNGIKKSDDLFVLPSWDCAVAITLEHIKMALNEPWTDSLYLKGLIYALYYLGSPREYQKALKMVCDFEFEDILDGRLKLGNFVISTDMLKEGESSDLVDAIFLADFYEPWEERIEELKNIAGHPTDEVRQRIIERTQMRISQSLPAGKGKEREEIRDVSIFSNSQDGVRKSVRK